MIDKDKLSQQLAQEAEKAATEAAKQALQGKLDAKQAGLASLGASALSERPASSARKMSVEEKRELLKDMEITYTSKRVDALSNFSDGDLQESISAEAKRELLKDMDITHESKLVDDLSSLSDGNLQKSMSVEEKRELLKDMEINYTSRRVDTLSNFSDGDLQENMSAEAKRELLQDIDMTHESKLVDDLSSLSDGNLQETMSAEAKRELLQDMEITHESKRVDNLGNLGANNLQETLPTDPQRDLLNNTNISQNAALDPGVTQQTFQGTSPLNPSPQTKTTSDPVTPEAPAPDQAAVNLKQATPASKNPAPAAPIAATTSDVPRVPMPMAIEELNCLVINLPSLDFLYEWDFASNASDVFLVLAESEDGPWRSQLPLSELDASTHKGWKTASFEESICAHPLPKQGLFDLSIQWEQDGEKKTVMLFEKIALDDLNTGCFSENNPEEPLFGEL